MSRPAPFYAIVKPASRRWEIWRGDALAGPQMIFTRWATYDRLKDAKKCWPDAVRWPMLDKLTRDLL